MSEIAIQLNNVYKSYTRGRMVWPWARWFAPSTPHHDELRRMVIDDVTLSVAKGERIALIGNNGAGKSTLLKLISNILVPDAGNITVHGRISSLLELGIGFHPEMTGIENVYFYGAMMGLRRPEVTSLLPEIEAFAEIGAYIQQPVKMYSSGMYQRLAFASAFAMHPDILIADEGLSVGDATFQQKCLNRIEDLGKQGTTILVVAHSAAATMRIASRGIWLQNGKIHQDGPIAQVAEAYASHMTLEAFERAAATLPGEIHRVSSPYLLFSESIRVSAVYMQSADNSWDATKPLMLHADVDVSTPEYVGRMRVRIIGAAENTPVVENDYIATAVRVFRHGKHTVRITVPPQSLKPGLYRIGVAMFTPEGTDRDAANSTLFVRVTNPHTAPDAAWLTTDAIVIEDADA